MYACDPYLPALVSVDRFKLHGKMVTITSYTNFQEEQNKQILKKALALEQPHLDLRPFEKLVIAQFKTQTGVYVGL